MRSHTIKHYRQGKPVAFATDGFTRNLENKLISDKSVKDLKLLTAIKEINREEADALQAISPIVVYQHNVKDYIADTKEIKKKKYAKLRNKLRMDYVSNLPRTKGNWLKKQDDKLYKKKNVYPYHNDEGSFRFKPVSSNWDKSNWGIIIDKKDEIINRANNSGILKRKIERMPVKKVLLHEVSHAYQFARNPFIEDDKAIEKYAEKCTEKGKIIKDDKILKWLH